MLCTVQEIGFLFIISSFSLVNQDWFEGQCNGNTGIFPASFVEEVPVSGQ